MLCSVTYGGQDVIDPLTEDVFPLSAAPTNFPFPARRRGAKPHISTIYRWAVHGCRGIYLETIQVGGTRCTSRESLRRFFEGLTKISGGHSVDSMPTPRSPSRRERETARAIRELEDAGA